MGRITEWRKLPVNLTELCIATTLRCGQSFRWKQDENDTWTCTLRGRVVQLGQESTCLRYRSIWPTESSAPTHMTSQHPDLGHEAPIDDDKDLIFHYLNLQPNLDTLYRQWSAADANFKRKAPKFTGVRILRQDAWEALIGFICSSNNNILRISQMVDKLCTHYGPYIATVDGRAFHDFPTAAALTGPGVETHLRELGFGYRAKYIAQTARMVADERPEGWLDSLRNPESPVYGHAPASAGEMRPEGRDGYREAHEKLLALQGVGPKVADCVCLMGLGWGEAVPVDTHVWQIAQRDYKFGRGKHSSLTKATYDAIGNHFRQLWGQEAGWAHSVLFTADLRVFADRLTTQIAIKSEVPDGGETDASLVQAKRVTLKRAVEEDEKPVEVTIDEIAITTRGRSTRRRKQ